MGIVYEAEQLGAREFVKRIAIKVVRQHYANQKEFIENFIGEAKLVADLIHTNIVQTYHLGETNGVYFIAMELIRGVNLEQFAQQLTDFGIAKARGFLVDNEGEVVAGKADYMSPEQANFQITDQRSDLFSAGVVLAHLLLGKNIFKGATAEESRQHMMTLPIPDFRSLDARVDDRLNEILHRALARELGQRYQSGGELLYDLEHYIYHSGYGPTNETLGKFIRELFSLAIPPTDVQTVAGSTQHFRSNSRNSAKS